jgi:hypothetical protein
MLLRVAAALPRATPRSDYKTGAVEKQGLVVDFAPARLRFCTPLTIL